MKFLGGCDL